MRSGPALAACCLALAAGSVMARTSPLRGVVEGYYGRPWSGDARRSVIRFLGARGMNAFVYGPKNDPYHRDRWREHYPDDELADLRDTAAAARRARVRFIYAISPGLDICYACDEDFDALTGKLDQLAHDRIRHFALFFDDGPVTLTRSEDVARYGGSDEAALARAHADVVNRTDRWLRRRGLHGVAFMIPSAYSGTTCLPYHTALAGALRRKLPVGWTGPGVFAPTLTGAEARARRDCLDGHPVILWDNFPVNDGVLSNTIHLGPLVGRDATLPGELAGYLLNPMTQAHASLIGLGTAAAYLKHPKRYDPEAAWRRTLADLDDSGGLAVLAEQTRDSPLSDPDYDDAHALAVALAGLEASWDGAEWTPGVDALEVEVRRQAAAPDTIAAHLAGDPLASEIAPWVAELAAHAARQLDAVRLLRAMKPGFPSLAARVDGAMLVVSGSVAPPDAALAATLAPAFTGATLRPDIAEYVRCLGNLLGPDIRLCTEFGLNVHGKGFYLVPFDIKNVRLITGKNVHERLVQFVGDRHRAWATRQQSGGDGLSLTLDGAPVAIGGDGTFALTAPLPPGGSARLALATAAGDVTALQVP
jgi:hypothetical protein